MSHVRRRITVLLVGLLVLGVSPLAGQRLSVAQALDLYERGEHSRARASLVVRELGVNMVRLTVEADTWIRTAPEAEQPRRRMVAAAFAIDFVANQPMMFLTSWPGGVTRLSGERKDSQLLVIAWACQLAKSSPPSDAEYWWSMASVEMFVQTSQWEELYGRKVQKSGPPPLGSFAVRNELEQGHLWHVKLRFPAEQQWRRVGLYRAEDDFRALGRLRVDRALNSGVTLRFDELSEANIAMLTGPPSMEVTNILARNAWGSLRKVLEDLAEDPHPGLRNDARLHAVYWQLVMRDWKGALEQLDTIELNNDDVAYLVALFRGWARQRLGQSRDAAAAYRVALARVPRAQSATTLLAPIEFLEGGRAEAYRLLDAAFSPPVVAADPWVPFRFGEPDRLARYLENMRKALQ